MEARNSIRQLKELFEGRRVLRVVRRAYEGGDLADYPTFYLDDGSEVVLYDANGFPPFADQERKPFVEPLLWEGDGA